jgi:putative flippase GtrA
MLKFFQLEAIWLRIGDRKMNKKELLRTLKFTLFSASAGIIQVASFTLLNEVLHLEYWFSYLVSLVLSVLWNFTLNRKYTFRSAANVPIAMLKVALYYVAFTPLSTWWTAWLTGESVGWNEYVVLALTMIVNFTTEFLYDRFIVFGKSIDTNVKEEKRDE